MLKCFRAFCSIEHIVQSLQAENNDARAKMCIYCIITNIILSSRKLFGLAMSPPFISLVGSIEIIVRFWGKSNPKAIREQERDSRKLVVWCAVSSTGLTAPFFFRGKVNHTTTVTEANYLHMLNSLLCINFGRRMTCPILFFNKMGPLPILPDVRDFLNTNFLNRWIWSKGKGSSTTTTKGPHTLWLFSMGSYQKQGVHHSAF